MALGSLRERQGKAGPGWGGEGGVGRRRASGFRPAPSSCELRGSRPRYPEIIPNDAGQVDDLIGLWPSCDYSELPLNKPESVMHLHTH
ncbi:hypothetical protein CapIbe_006503 [Capra ibex]